MSTALPSSPHGELIRALLPPVSYDPLGAHVAASCTADGLALDRVYGASGKVLLGLEPFRDTDWLADYERVYGLPGPCFSGELSLDERIRQLALALRERRGISREFYLWLAGVFGYAVTIEEHSAFTAGSSAGQGLYNDFWRYVWTVRTVETPWRAFCAGRNSGGDALRIWGDDRFECIFRSFSPAYTVVHFAYGSNNL